MEGFQKPISQKAVLSVRPFSARHAGYQRILKGSFELCSNTIVPVPKIAPNLQDIGTSMSPIKFEELELNQIPIKNISFQHPSAGRILNKKRGLVVKTSRAKSNSYKIVGLTQANQSRNRLFSIDKPKKDAVAAKQRNTFLSRPSTGKSSGPITKRLLSELNFDQAMGTRLFDISDVLSVTHGQINLKTKRTNRSIL